MRDSLVRLNRSCSHVEKLAATNYPADAELNGPAILLQELVADEGVDRVIRAVERGLMVYDATTTFLVQRSTSLLTGASIQILSSGSPRDGDSAQTA